MPEKKTLSGDWERAGHGTDEKIGARSNLLVKGDGKRVCLFQELSTSGEGIIRTGADLN